MNTITDIRPSPIAGQWYSSNPEQLAAEIDSYIEAAQLPTIVGEVTAIMSPHAGIRYSGPVAAYAFKTLQGLSPDIVAVISPMHHPYYEPLLTTAHDAYGTPLGAIPVDKEALNLLNDQLKERLGFGLTRIKNDPEHSLEIELPFLQRVLHKPFLLLPVMVREQSASVARALGAVLANVLSKRNAILVASTDLSHFYPQNVAEILDATILDRVRAFDPQGIFEVEAQGKGFACGRGGLAAVLWAAKGLGANHVQILNYATSGDITGDYSQVVGYGAAVITRQAED